MLLRRALVCAVLLFVAFPGAAQDAGERILRFHSHIELAAGGSMTVRETIRVRAAGERIRRGILRDFPTRYRDDYGNRVVVGFEVLEVTRDGQREPYRVEDISNGKRVRIGQADVFLRPGDYTYEIVYRTDRQLGFFAQHDELYWNVTGNGWDFPIDQASAEVRLPADAPRIQSAEGYTGPQGAKERALSAEVTFEGAAGFATTRPLGPGEGLTIVATFPKGYFAAPTREQQVHYFFADNRSTAIGLLALAALLLYYALAWVAVGRDPARGAVVPRFDAPDGMSPAAVRYLVRMGYDDKVFAAAIVNLAVKGRLRIREEEGVYTLERTGSGDDGAAGDERFRTPRERLTPDEREVQQRLLGGRKQLELENSNHSHISGAISALKKNLSARLEKTYFLRNGRYILPGVALTLLFVLALVFAETGERRMVAGFMSVWLTGWTVGVFFLVGRVCTLWAAVIRGRGWGSRLLTAGGAGFMTLFAAPFVAGEIFGLYMLSTATSAAAVGVLFALALLNYLFYHLMKAPTLLGREVLDHIDGLRMFLVESEAARHQGLDPPQRTPQTFEKYLPYAIALDLEDEWAQQFSAVLAAAAAAPGGEDRSYLPYWYHGGLGRNVAPRDLASSLGSSFRSAISSSSTAPGSSSGSSGGSSGGGSSGGGGGGGGGGGW